MRQEKEISKNFYRFWRMSNLRGFLGRCAKVVANSKYFYNFGSMRQNVGELRKKSSPKFGFAKRCRIDPKFGASTQKASQIRHSPKFALFSGFKLWRIVRSPVFSAQSIEPILAELIEPDLCPIFLNLPETFKFVLVCERERA